MSQLIVGVNELLEQLKRIEQRLSNLASRVSALEYGIGVNA